MKKYKKQIPENAKVVHKHIKSYSKASSFSEKLIEKNIFFEMYGNNHGYTFDIYPKIKFDDMVD